MKRIVVFGIAVLLLFGCICAAGCISSNTTDPVAGHWQIFQTDIGNGEIGDMFISLKSDGTGKSEVLINNSRKYKHELLWKNLGNKTYEFKIYRVKAGDGDPLLTVYYTISDSGSKLYNANGRGWEKTA